MNQSFLIRNIPKKIQKQTRYEIKLVNQNLGLKKELNLYKSLFTTHRHSAICNMYIKRKKGKELWIDKVRDHFDFHELDEDPEVKEWLKPIKCER